MHAASDTPSPPDPFERRSGLPILLKKSTVSFINLRRIAEEQSALKVVFVTAFMTALVAGLWLLFYSGFRFIDHLGGGLMIIQRLFAIFFFGLGLLLVISSGIAAYTTIYRSEEIPFLLLQPLTLADVMYYKLIETSLLSFWAFFIIIIPFVGAYAWHQELSVFFAVWTLLFSIPFVMLNSAIGSLITVVLVRFCPRNRRVWQGLLLLAVASLAWIFLANREVLDPNGSTDVLLARMVPGIQFASNPIWPSYWVSEGILSLSRGYWQRGGTFLALLIANVFFFALLFEGIGTRCFYQGWQRTIVSASRDRSKSVSWRWLDKKSSFLAPDIRGLVMKDIRIFCRDPAQWLQGVIFFGLLAVYFVNLRNLDYHSLPVAWRNLITFLNIFGVSAVMCSFGTRFIYPQPSLEGQGFWIVGMSPTTMGRVLAAKFGLALTGLGLVSVLLMYLSVTMLNLPGSLKAVAMLIALCMAVAISGLSVGLGAIFLDLKQRNPAAIISGFGGTLNLVLSLAFMLASIIPFGFLFHLEFTGALNNAAFSYWRNAGYVWLIGLSLICSVTPLLLGRRAMLHREY